MLLKQESVFKNGITKTKGWLSLFAGLALVCSAGFCADPPAASEAAAPNDQENVKVDPNAVIAKVNGQPITQGELEQEIGNMLRSMSPNPLPPEAIAQLRPRVEPQAFDQLVLKIQIAAYAKANNVTVSDASITGELTKLQSRFPDVETFHKVLTEQGMTAEDLEEQIREQMTLSTAVQGYVAGVPSPTDASMEAYYQENLAEFTSDEKVAASHILLGFDPGESDEGKKDKLAQAEALKKSLADGGDFEALAKEHSTCPSGQSGGSLGEFGRGQMVPPFEAAAFELEPGVVSDVVETQFGYHLIRVSEHNEGKVSPYEEVKEQVEDTLKQGSLETWFTELVSGADVERI